MRRLYYNSRQMQAGSSLSELFRKTEALYLMFREKNFFKQSSGLSANYFPDSLKHEVVLFIGFQALPLRGWQQEYITAENLFSIIEFLFDRASKPGAVIQVTENGFTYQDFEDYDSAEGKKEFREAANSFLITYGDGYELGEDGEIRLIGTEGLQYIFSAEVPKFDEANVDSKVRLAISKWRNRHAGLEDRKEAIRLIADAFEYLKKSGELETSLDSKDSSDLFNIANNFSIRHHSPQQKLNYDRAIWYSWMFHFYLATYHASVRLIIKRRLSSAPTN